MIHIEGLQQKKILLVDDEKEILQLLETVLLKEGFASLYKASSGVEAIELCKTYHPDLIVLDIMLPDMEGFEVCKQIRTFSLSPIIFLSARTEDIDKLMGLGVGGDDYVTKPFSPKEVAFRIKAQLRRNQYQAHTLSHVPPESEDSSMQIGEIEIFPERSEVLLRNKPVTLTAKEFQLLICMARHVNRILSKRQLCEHVWGEDDNGYDNTIMVHIRHLREKLETDPGKPTYIQTVKGLGYKLTAGRSESGRSES
ncbi:response regulator transcription factor [Marinicrinis sediminis]|uniref:Response regulator transcription factor n=1 Tax=Marinicrinis sediminis TaxID=1652465 RepID=A0ABW5R8M0_9BACL